MKCDIGLRGEFVYFVLIWKRLKFCFMLIGKTNFFYIIIVLNLFEYFSEETFL